MEDRDTLVRLLNDIGRTPCVVPAEGGHLSWVLARIEQLAASYRELGVALEGGLVLCSPELLAVLEGSDLPEGWDTDLDEDLVGDTYLMDIYVDVPRVDSALRSVAGFAMEGLISAEEVALRWVFQEVDGMEVDEATEAARLLL